MSARIEIVDSPQVRSQLFTLRCAHDASERRFSYEDLCSSHDIEQMIAAWAIKVVDAIEAAHLDCRCWRIQFGTNGDHLRKPVRERLDWQELLNLHLFQKEREYRALLYAQT